MKKRVSVLIPEHMHRRIRQKSDETGISVSHILRQALYEWAKDCDEGDGESEDNADP